MRPGRPSADDAEHGVHLGSWKQFRRIQRHACVLHHDRQSQARHQRLRNAIQQRRRRVRVRGSVLPVLDLLQQYVLRLDAPVRSSPVRSFPGDHQRSGVCAERDRVLHEQRESESCLCRNGGAQPFQPDRLEQRDRGQAVRLRVQRHRHLPALQIPLEFQEQRYRHLGIQVGHVRHAKRRENRELADHVGSRLCREPVHRDILRSGVRPVPARVFRPEFRIPDYEAGLNQRHHVCAVSGQEILYRIGRHNGGRRGLQGVFRCSSEAVPCYSDASV
jgi:hypothetical protein